MAENGDAPAPVVPEICPDLVQEILLRLPAADVHRCRFVCKAWRKLISVDQDFIRTYRQRHPPMPLFFYRRDFSLGVPDLALPPGVARPARVDLQAIDLAARESRLVLRFPDVPDAGPRLNQMCIYRPMPSSVFCLEGSCDGVLLLLYGDRVYLCNPCTRHWALLPAPAIDRPGPHRIVAFFPGEGQEFQILYEAGQRMDDLSYWIRRIRHEQEDLFEIDGPSKVPDLDRKVMLRSATAMLPGSLYWSVLSLTALHILVFHTERYEFQWIAPPEDGSGDQFIPWFKADGFNASQVFEVGGMVAMRILNNGSTMADVWVLHDPDSRAWARRWSIRLPGAEMLRNGAFRIGVPVVHVVSQEPEVLVRCPHAMLQSGADGSVRQSYQRPHHWTIATRFMLEESFVLHPLLSAEGNDAEQPFFLFQ